MKKFNQFLKDLEPTLITALPTHGGHACAKKKAKDKKETVKEDSETQEHEHVHRWVEDHDNHHLGKNVDEVHEKLNHSHEKFWSHPEQAGAVHKYTSGSSDLNAKLIRRATDRAGYKMSAQFDSQKDSHFHQIKHMDRAIKNSKLEHDVHVYHGTSGWHPGDAAAKHPEGHVKIPAYTSTSLSRQKAHGFSFEGDSHKNGNHILHIHLKKGQKAKYLGSNSEYEHEKEMLLPRNTTLKIHPIPEKKKDSHANGGHVHVWHAHVVD